MSNKSIVKLNKKQRSVGLDVLRCIAMMMVVVLHFLGKGDLLPDMMKAESWSLLGIAEWTIEAICIVAVNVYMLISGYFLCESHFKLSRLISLYIQLWTYSFGIGMLAYLTGLAPRDELDTYRLLTLGLPVSMGHYWFMTAYVYFYLLLPLLGMAVRKMSEVQHRVAVIMLLLVICVLKSVLPFKLEMDGEGYDFLWYAIMFLVAAYIRRYEPKFINKKSSAVMMVIGMCGSLAEILAIGKVGMMTGALEYVSRVSMHYNHIFPFLGALGLFGLFIPKYSLKENDNKSHKVNVMSKIVIFIAPLTLGVYLLHENVAVRYMWQEWFGCTKVDNVLGLVGYTVLAAVCVFITGVIVEFIRSRLFGLIYKGLKCIKPYKLLVEKIECVDRVFADKICGDK